MKQTLNQLLVELDGFQQGSGIVVIAATNFPQLLDKALIRPGRFDKTVTVDLPDVRGRLQILEQHAKNVAISSDVDFKQIARSTTGFSGADLANLVNQAAVKGSRDRARAVTMAHFDWAKDKITMGAALPSRVTRPEDKMKTCVYIPNILISLVRIMRAAMLWLRC
jgi:ATP-dependent metalloprotease